MERKPLNLNKIKLIVLLNNITHSIDVPACWNCEHFEKCLNKAKQSHIIIPGGIAKTIKKGKKKVVVVSFRADDLVGKMGMEFSADKGLKRFEIGNGLYYKYIGCDRWKGYYKWVRRVCGK